MSARTTAQVLPLNPTPGVPSTAMEQAFAQAMAYSATATGPAPAQSGPADSDPAPIHPCAAPSGLSTVSTSVSPEAQFWADVGTALEAGDFATAKALVDEFEVRPNLFAGHETTVLKARISLKRSAVQYEREKAASEKAAAAQAVERAQATSTGLGLRALAHTLKQQPVLLVLLTLLAAQLLPLAAKALLVSSVVAG